MPNGESTSGFHKVASSSWQQAKRNKTAIVYNTTLAVVILGLFKFIAAGYAADVEDAKKKADAVADSQIALEQKFIQETANQRVEQTRQGTMLEMLLLDKGLTPPPKKAVPIVVYVKLKPGERNLGVRVVNDSVYIPLADTMVVRDTI